MSRARSEKAKRAAWRRGRRRLARQDVLRKRKSGGLLKVISRKNKVKTVRAPEVMYLFKYKSHTAITNFLSDLRSGFGMSGETLVLDFRRTRLLMPGATLLFYSELKRLVHLFPGKAFKFLKSHDSTVNEVLEHLGIYELAGYRSGAIPAREDVVNWRVVSSVTTDGPLAGGLIETYESLSKREIGKIFKGVSEAATNAVEHAYVEDRNDNLPKFSESRWWMFCRESNKRLYVGVCDLGVGIPRSLPRTFGERAVAALLSGISWGSIEDDSAMIRAAMEIARTRTDKDERGKGLGDMKTVVDKLPGSQLYIFSNKGMVSYSGGAFSSKSYKNSILGTMVTWVIPIEGVA